MVSHLEQAKTHMDRREFGKAIKELTLHLNGDFHDDTAIFMLGACHLQAGNTGLAAVLNRQAIECRQQKGLGVFPEAIGNLAACFKQAMKSEAAADLWEMALAMETDPMQKAQFYMNLGGCYTNRGEPETALKYYEKSLALRPDLLRAQFNKAFVLLEMGRWREGWEAFEVGLTSGDRKDRVYGQGDHGQVPEWDGTPGQTVIVWGEQGIGDEILYASCIPDLVKVSKQVIFDCHPRLEDLFKRSFPDVTVYGTRKTQSEIPWLEDVEPDARVCISSLPRHFRNADNEFPGRPFLKAQPWKGVRTLPRIGISWKGGTKQTHSDVRTIPLAEWEPLIRSIDADWYSLQYTPDAAEDVCRFEEATGLKVHHYPGKVQCKNYDETATFVNGLDLTITVCTAMHHLSNAIGKETWTLVPSCPAWRYAAKGELWYSKTSRFFRQEKDEAWGAVIDRVAAALRVKFAEEKAA